MNSRKLARFYTKFTEFMYILLNYLILLYEIRPSTLPSVSSPWLGFLDLSLLNRISNESRWVVTRVRWDGKASPWQSHSRLSQPLTMPPGSAKLRSKLRNELDSGLLWDPATSLENFLTCRNATSFLPTWFEESGGLTCLCTVYYLCSEDQTVHQGLAAP